MSNWREAALFLLSGGHPVIEPVPRGPLPPFDADTVDPDTGAPLPVHTTLPYPIPPERSVRYWRGNFGAMTIPGLPPIPGGASGPAGEMVLTWFLDRWSEAWQHTILKTYCERGYTHFTLSWPDSRDGAGQSVGAYVATAQRVASYGLYVDHHFFSGDFDGHNPPPEKADAVIDALLDAQAIHVGTVGWELNEFCDPSYIQRLIDRVTGPLVAEKIPTYLHFLPHYASWQEDHEAPGDFWRRQMGKITGLKYQCVPEWSAGMMQARINDVLVRLIGGGLWGVPQTFDVVAWETVLQSQFNNVPGYSEDYGDLIGYETLCTPGPMPVAGFGNGGRMPSGAVI